MPWQGQPDQCHQSAEAGDLTQQVVLDKGGEQRESYTYTYDNKGNITQVKDSKGTTTYVYDQLEQLVKETQPDGTVAMSQKSWKLKVAVS
nr:hypothetical protein [Kroppenstedtia guangzhouensis]